MKVFFFFLSFLSFFDNRNLLIQEIHFRETLYFDPHIHEFKVFSWFLPLNFTLVQMLEEGPEQGSTTSEEDRSGRPEEGNEAIQQRNGTGRKGESNS